MIYINDGYCSKKESLDRCKKLMQTSHVFFADGSFVAGKNMGGYAFMKVGDKSFYKKGIDIAFSPVEMELQAIKHTLIYLNSNQNKFNELDIVIFNDCLQSISKIKNYIQNPNKSNKILEEIFMLLLSLNKKNIYIYWIKKEILSYHEQVDSLSKAARDFIR